MEDDFIQNIDILLKRGMIESENGLDKYNEQIQKNKNLFIWILYASYYI